MNKIIRDPIHKDIDLSEVELKILDTPQMQRLRRIKQNGLAYIVYPAMNATRFEHSLGVMYLAGKVAAHLNLSKDDAQDLRLAGLLHDIGHLPFSHLLKIKNFSHEQNSARIIKQSEIADILNFYGIKADKIISLVFGQGVYGKIISSDIDVDKMDYLNRDSYYAGVAYGIIDVDRIIRSMKFYEKNLIIDEGGLEAVEKLLIARNMMHQTVYGHHTKRIAESMFSRAYEYANLSIEKLCEMDDCDLLNFLENEAKRTNNSYIKEILTRIKNRDLFKRFYSAKYQEIGEIFCRDIEEDKRKFEYKICDALNIPYDYLLVDLPEIRLKEYDAMIKSDEHIYKIDEISELAKALKQTEISRLSFCIYADGKYIDKQKDFIPEKFIPFKQRRLEI